MPTCPSRSAGYSGWSSRPVRRLKIDGSNIDVTKFRAPQPRFGFSPTFRAAAAALSEAFLADGLISARFAFRDVKMRRIANYRSENRAVRNGISQATHLQKG
jgi:hypothetical protein